MSDEPPRNQPPTDGDLPSGVNRGTLDALLHRAAKLQQEGEPEFLDSALEELPAPVRDVYRRTLAEQFPRWCSSTYGDTAESDPSGTLLIGMTDSEQAASPDVGTGPLDKPASPDAWPSLNQTEFQSDEIAGTVLSDQGPPTIPGDDGPPMTELGLATIDGSNKTSSSIPHPTVKSGKKENETPKRIGKFRIDGELGRGAFGVVYLGFDEELHRNVAIKVSLVSDPKLQQRLKVEASKAAQIDSDGIVPVYHIGTTDGGAVYIVQKYIQGSELRDIIREGPLSPAATARLIRDIALGLERAHQSDILHRDLKPDNILIEESGRVWIADFGLAISEAEQSSGKRELAGTLPYMSPEQIQGRIDFLDPRSDIWALGVMYYELLTGKLPFTGSTRQMLSEQICERDPRPLQQIAAGRLTESINHVFQRCCAKQPSDRFSTVRELAIALDELIAGGLSDENIDGELMENRLGGHPFEYPTGFGSSGLRRRGDSTFAESGRMSTTTGTLHSLTQTFQTRQGSWVVLQALFAVTLIAGLSILGYKRFFPSPKRATAESSTIDQTPILVPPSDTESHDLESPSQGRPSQGRPSQGSPEPGSLETDPVPPRVIKAGTSDDPFLVALDSTGSHDSIAGALSEGKPDSFIDVMPGLYHEALLFTAGATLLGRKPDAGEELLCELENADVSPIVVDCPEQTVTIRHFFIDGKGKQHKSKFNAVEIRGGTVVIENCVLTTSSLNCIKVLGTGVLQIRDCQFLDSNEFSISTRGDTRVDATGCEFDVSGIQFVGSVGSATQCKFYGKKGIHAARNKEPVQVDHCVFDGCRDFGISITSGGQLLSRENEILRCEVGVLATLDAKQTSDSENVDAAKVRLIGTTIGDCRQGVVVDGSATLLATDQSQISNCDTGVGIGNGTVTLRDTTVSHSKLKGLWGASDKSNVSLERIHFDDCDTAIEMTGGNLTFEEGSIRSSSYAVVWGDREHREGMKTDGELRDVEITGCRSAAIFANAGSLLVQDARIQGGKYGLVGNGRASDALSSPASIDVQLRQTRFGKQTDDAIYAQGDTHIRIDEVTWKTLQNGSQVQKLHPAAVTVDGKE